MSTPAIGDLLLNFKFADMPSPYTPARLQLDLAAGVGNILAGIGSNYRLGVDTALGFITAAHKDAVYNAYSVVADTTNTRLPALAITANGIAMGYNDVDGTWKNAVAIDAAAGTATFSGAINATSGNFVDSITVGGVTLAAIKAGAAAGVTAVQPAALAGYATAAALAAKLDNAAATVMASGFSLKTTNYDSTSPGAGGVAIYNGGIIGRKRNAGNTGWDTTFAIDTNGNPVFAGTITAAQVVSGTFTGISVNTTGSISSSGVSAGGALSNVSIYGSVTGASHVAIGGISANGTGIYGSSAAISQSGVYGTHTGGGDGVTGICISTGTGVRGTCNTSGGTGVAATGTAGAVGLRVTGGMTTDSSALVTNLNADYLDGYHASSFLLTSGTAANSSAVGGVGISSLLQNGGSTSGNPGTAFTHTLYITGGGITVRVPCFYP